MEEVQLQVVVENLLNGERDARIQAAREIAKMSSKQRHKIAENGLISPLVSMLYSQDYEPTQAALFALLSLAFGSERNKIRIVKSGAIPVLLELLQCQSEELTELTVAALLILSSCKPNKLKIASSGAIQLLVDHILNDATDRNMNNSVTMQAKLDAIATLHNLSTCHQIVPSIVSSGAAFSLLHQINCSDKSSQLVEKAMGLLECIVTSSEDALQGTASTGGAIGALVETVEEGSELCKEHAVGILLLMCKSCRETYRGLILREGAIPGLLQLSMDGTRRAKGAARELLLLLRDCSSSRSQQSKYELMEQIMQEIDAEGGDRVGGTTLRMVEEMIARLST